MLNEQDARAVEAMVRCNMEIDELCEMFPVFEREDICAVKSVVEAETIGICEGMHSVSMNCS